MSITADTTVEQAFDYACNQAPDKDKAWMILWQLGDVRAEAKDQQRRLTIEECQEALRYFRDHYDYVWEVSWHLMAEAIKHVVEERTKKGAKVT